MFKERLTTAIERIERTAKFPFSRKGRVILAFLIGLGSVGDAGTIQIPKQPSTLISPSFLTFPGDYSDISRESPDNLNESYQPCIEGGFNPDAIRDHAQDATFLEVRVLEACRAGLMEIEANLNQPSFAIDGLRAKDELHPILVHLKDDGTGGDRMRGDGTFTSGEIRIVDPLLVYNQEGIASLGRARPLQTINIINEACPRYEGLTLRYDDSSEKKFPTPSLWVLDPSISLNTRTDRFGNFQIGERIINIRDDQSLADRFLSWVDWGESAKQLAKSLYSIEPDTDPYDVIFISSSQRLFVTPHHCLLNNLQGLAMTTRVDFSGTGQEMIDLTKEYGSRGQLGLITAVTSYGALSHSLMLDHELIHRYAAYLNKRLGLNKEAHWKNNTSVAGVLGGTRWQSNGDGTFTTFGPLFTGKLSQLELYLAGWLPPEKLEPIKVALDENQCFTCSGRIIHGPFDTVTAEDIIAAHGVRTPGPNQAPRHFQLAFLYPTKGRLATPTEMKVRELLAEALPYNWHEATDFNSTIEFLVPFAPRIIEPQPTVTLPTLATQLEFTAHQDTKWIHLQLRPVKDDGPGVNLIIGDQALIQKGQFKLEAPILGQGPYIALPDMGYTWRIRTSTSISQPDLNQDTNWSPWVKREFRTPKRNSDNIRLLTPSQGQATDDPTPILQWANFDPDVFNYEIQLSKDPDFNTDPQTAHSPLYWMIVHGGESHPSNSWHVPDQFPLEPGQTYYWRVRPKIQGDGTPVAWGSTDHFNTSAKAN